MKMKTRFLPDLHAYKWEDGIAVKFQKFEDRREGLIVEATYTHDGTMLDFGKINLSSPSTRKTQAKSLGAESIVSADEWLSRLKIIAFQSVHEWRNGGEALIDLGAHSIDYDKAAFMLEPMVSQDGISILYGDGSAGKSLFSLAMMLSICTGEPLLGVTPARKGRCAYYDWEDTADNHSERLRALIDGNNLDYPDNGILYRNPDRPIRQVIERIQAEVADNDIELVCIDSMGMAAGGDPSDPSLIIDAMNSCKSLGVPVIVIHHLSAESASSNNLQLKSKPYGSVYARNAARNLWLIEKKQELDSEESLLYLTHTKANHGPLRSRLAFDVRFDNAENHRMIGATYEQVSASNYSEDVKETRNDRISVRDAIEAVLQRCGRDGNPYSMAVSQILSIMKKEEIRKGTSKTQIHNEIKMHPDLYIDSTPADAHGNTERLWRLKYRGAGLDDESHF